MIEYPDGGIVVSMPGDGRDRGMGIVVMEAEPAANLAPRRRVA